MRLDRRLRRLEAGASGLQVIIIREELSAAEKQEAAEAHRRSNGLPAETAVIVLSGAEARL